MSSELDKKQTDNKPLNILLVENNDADIKIAKRAFEHAQLKSNVYVANNGQEALDFIYCEGKYKDKRANDHWLMVRRGKRGQTLLCETKKGI